MMPINEEEALGTFYNPKIATSLKHTQKTEEPTTEERNKRKRK